LIRKNLLDLNVLIALTDPEHQHHRKAQDWFMSSGKGSWGVCPLTEAGFIRVTTNPTFRPGLRTLEQAIAILQALKAYPGYWYWEIDESWVTLTARFAARILGHQQVTDAYLLGLAIKENGVLVTFDRGLKYMAGAEFRNNLLVLE
jgi:toxin-antitoxin system PIN domain toxin